MDYYVCMVLVCFEGDSHLNNIYIDKEKYFSRQIFSHLKDPQKIKTWMSYEGKSGYADNSRHCPGTNEAVTTLSNTQLLCISVSRLQKECAEVFTAFHSTWKHMTLVLKIIHLNHALVSKSIGWNRALLVGKHYCLSIPKIMGECPKHLNCSFELNKSLVEQR